MNDAKQTMKHVLQDMLARLAIEEERVMREDAERVIVETRRLIAENLRDREPLVEGTTVIEVPLE